MSSNDSINSTFSNVTGGDASADGGVAVRAATLVLMQCFIIPGNSLVLASIISFTKRSVADVLIGCLALIDLVNGLGPVNISISMYFINLSGSNRLKDLEWLCLLYTWLSTCLRLMACFVATMMAIDRFAAILAPFFYRTRVTPRATCLCLLLVFMFCILTATLPLAISTIRTYIPLCSFDFTSPFAAFIAVLGYLQLFVVVLSYLSVICGVNAFLSRQTMIRATQIRASIAVSKSKNRENTLAETSHGVVTNRSSPLTLSRFPRHLSIDCEVNRNRSSSLSPITKAARKSLANKQRSRSLGQVLTKRESLSRIFSMTNLNRGRSTSKAPELTGSANPDEAVATAATAKRGSDFEVIQEVPFNTEDEEKVQMSLKQFKRNNSTWKHSRRLAIVMGIVVLLFYISWMPIVVMMLYYIILYYIILYYIILYYIILYYIILYYIILYYVILYYIIYVILYYIILCYTILYYIILHYIISYYIILHYIILYYILLYYISFILH